MFYLCLTLSTSLHALWPQLPSQRKGNTKVSLWALTLKRNKHHVGEQGLSSHLSFLQTAKYTTFPLRPAMVLCAEDTPIHIRGMNGMLTELRLSFPQGFLLSHSQMERRRCHNTWRQYPHSKRCTESIQLPGIWSLRENCNITRTCPWPHHLFWDGAARSSSIPESVVVQLLFCVGK